MTRRATVVLCLFATVLVAPTTARAKHGDPPRFKPERLRRRAGVPKPPWRRRFRPTRMRSLQGLVDLARWPKEPATPPKVDAAKLARALEAMCGWMPPRRAKKYAAWLLEGARLFGSDPFLVGGLMYRQSLCLPNAKSDYGIGLTGINPRMHARYIRRRRYRYWTLEGGRWQRHELRMPKYLFFARGLRYSHANIYFASALTSLWRKQCPHIDGAFGSLPHRHYVSHFIWGDRVRGAAAEDRVLRARRRLLQYYRQGKQRGLAANSRAKQGDLVLAPPLDAMPRQITSAMGDDRSGGKRRHRGVDFSSTYGEPVRAVADGLVVLAGYDAAVGPSRNISPSRLASLKGKRLGAGGLYVIIRHATGVRSLYMHLAKYRVRAGQRVKTGQIIGVVGRSGMKRSSAHLHFELRSKRGHIDPLPALRPYVFRPDESWDGRKNAWEQKRVRRIRRIRRWRRRKRAKARRAQAQVKR